MQDRAERRDIIRALEKVPIAVKSCKLFREEIFRPSMPQISDYVIYKKLSCFLAQRQGSQEIFQITSFLKNRRAFDIKDRVARADTNRGIG